MRTVIVSGALANKPLNGGEAWVRLSWAMGLSRLGLRVYFVEQIHPGACADGAGARGGVGFHECINLHYFRAVTDRFELAGRSALIYGAGEASDGLTYAEVLELADSADLLVNISGHLTLGPVLDRVRRKAYVDIDPGFTQFWHDSGDLRLGGHDLYFTIGHNIGRPDCPIPAGGIPWRPVVQPVVLEHWPLADGDDDDDDATEPGRFTTVASWRGAYGPVRHGGRTYGVKAHEFRKFAALPRLAARAGAPEAAFEIALDIHPGDARDLAMLHQNGWHTADPRAAAATPDAFRRYVRHSAAEFSVAQGIYVDTNSGWFSDRTVRYLACGKPALVQDTGFGGYLPVGEGLVSFRSPEEAAAGAARIVRDYDGHCHAARAVAEEHFDSDKVLARFVEECGIRP